ncbi:unnamed protein product [Lymnaea stagnalis]|uniref:Cytosolic beta-glucosidase n=1 Tax=Lymnaea stagnalis TaxID=6523 RepID=A0A6G7S6U9_LYMST|nr:klotho [Lymnaea stagnalis]
MVLSMAGVISIGLVLACLTCLSKSALILDKFPQGFSFGVSSSAYPTEGAWDASGKGPSIWDEFTKTNGRIQGGGDGNKAADGYNKVKEDVQLLKSLGVAHYKFSLSWSRLLPDGTTGSVNQAGFAYYNSLIDELIANQITPFVTLYQWDLPQALQEKGGWSNDASATWFKDYANLCFSRFGDRVKLWTTIDDPVTQAYKGYETGEHAPGLTQPGLLYKVGHNLLLAHGEAYLLYKSTYKATQKGEVGMTLSSDWFVSKTGSATDATATARALTFQLGWFAEPLFNGDYPQLMKEKVALKRTALGVADQKLPEFTAQQKITIRGAFDFIGISHFKTKLVSEKASANSNPGFYNDQDVLIETDKSYPKLEYRPETNPDSDRRLMGFGLRELLNYLTNTYSKPAIYVTQNGLDTCGTLKDQSRIEYIREYSNNILQAIKAGSDVRGYSLWSLVDGFDWDRGYTTKTGLYYVDFGQDDRPRFPRSSANFYRALIANRGLNEDLRSYRAYPADRDEFHYGTFPEYFKWGVATSAYQVEGGWNLDGKGPSIWDTFAHNNRLANGETGDVACDSYHLYQEDVNMLKDLEVDFYRLSIAWSRVLPDGTSRSLNQKGVDYYNNVIDALLLRNITPMVTLYHWDLPQALEDKGGFRSDNIVDLFEDYARVCFEQFGDRVKHWITFNEAFVISWLGYGIGIFAPGVKDPGVGTYRVAHNIIRSHARAYHLYKNNFKAKYGGSVGITLDIEWKEPLTDSVDDSLAADRAIQFKLGWFGNALFGGSGDYPAVVKQYVAEKSRLQGLSVSRLPEFTDDEKALNKGAYDFLGMNHYTSTLVANKPRPDSQPSYEQDQDIYTRADPCWPSSDVDWLKINPWGIRYILRWAKQHFNNPPIYITESGRPSKESLDDPDRIYYYKYYINELLKAIDLDKVDLRGYTAWSLMDNLEWASAYNDKFGLYHVDFSSTNRTRTPRSSAQFYRQLIRDNGFPKP